MSESLYFPAYKPWVASRLISYRISLLTMARKAECDPAPAHPPHPHPPLCPHATSPLSSPEFMNMLILPCWCICIHGYSWFQFRFYLNMTSVEIPSMLTFSKVGQGSTTLIWLPPMTPTLRNDMSDFEGHFWVPGRWIKKGPSGL